MFRAPRRRADHHYDMPVDDEIASGLLQFTGSAIESGLTRLETANNWTLTVGLGVVIAIVSSGAFPGGKSLMLLCAAVPLVSHFMVRAMKGYINTIRFSVLNRAVVNFALSSGRDPGASFDDLREKIRIYHNEWRLPIARHHVWSKTLTEFSFGYISGGLAGLIIYDCIRIHLTFQAGAVCLALIAVAVSELASFHYRSPYMREGPKDVLAVRNR